MAGPIGASPIGATSTGPVGATAVGRYGETELRAAPSAYVHVLDQRGEYQGRRKVTEEEHEEWNKGKDPIDWQITEDREGRIMTRSPASRTQRAGSLAGLPGGDYSSRAAEAGGTQQDLQRNLGKQYGVDPGGFQFQRLEGLGVAFSHPEVTGGELRLLDSTDLEWADLGTAATEAPELIGEGIGAAYGLAKGGPAGITVGAATGAAAGRTLTNAALEIAGIVEDPDYVTDAAVSGTLAGIGSKLPGMKQGLKNVFDPTDRALDIIDPKLGLRAAGDTSVADLIGEGQKATTSIDTPLTTGQVVSSTPEGEVVGGRMLATEAAAADSAPFVEMAEGAAATRRKIMKELQPLEDTDTHAVGDVIVGRTQQKYDLEKAQIATDIGREKEIINSQLDDLLGHEYVSGSGVRAVLQQGRDRVYKRISEQYEALWENVPAGTQPDLTGLNAAALEWKAQLDRQITRSLTRKDRKLVDDIIEGIGRANKGGADLGDLQRDLSLLKKQRLKIGLKEVTEGTTRQKEILDKFINEIEAARYEALKKVNPDLADSIMDLDNAWRTAKEDIDEDLIGVVLKNKSKKQYKIEDDKVLDEFTRNRDDLEEYLRVAQKYPEVNALPDLKQVMQSKYRREVIDGGTSHASFMRQNGRKMELLYTPDEMKTFGSANKAKIGIENATERHGEMLRKLRATYGMQVRHFDPEQAVEFGMKTKSNAARLKAILPKDEWNVYRQLRRKRLVEGMGNNPSLEHLEGLLKGDSRDELLESLGPRYVRSLTELRNLVRVEGRKGTNKMQLRTVAEAQGVFDFGRGMIYGPLSSIGFRLNRANRFVRGSTNEAIERMLQDPDLLRQALDLRHATIRNRRWWSMMSALGFNTGAMAMDVGDPTIPIVDVKKVREMVK